MPSTEEGVADTGVFKGAIIVSDSIAMLGGDWILQKKVAYAEFVPTVEGFLSKAEIRMMFVWPDEDRAPTLVNNLVRMSQGKMMGVDFNKDKTWVGSSIALHES